MRRFGGGSYLKYKLSGSVTVRVAQMCSQRGVSRFREMACMWIRQCCIISLHLVPQMCSQRGVSRLVVRSDACVVVL